jgi:hypothetical protein
MFFKQFPASTFVFDNKSYVLEDITRRVIFGPDSFSNYSYIYDVDVGESRPDIVSHQLYGNVNYWWSLFVLNGITMNEWPMGEEELEEWMSDKYTDFQLNQTKRYLDDDGNEVPPFGFPQFTANGTDIRYQFNKDNFLNSSPMSKSKWNKQTLRDFLIQQNDDRKKIKAVRAAFIGQFFDDFRTKIQGDVDFS